MSRNSHARSILSQPADSRGADTLTLIEVTPDMLDDAANDAAPDESGEFPVYMELSAEDGELTDEDLTEVPAETTVVIGDCDIEILEPKPREPVIKQITPETVLIYCKPGDTLPPYAVPTGELPRFAMSAKRRPLPRFDETPSAPPASSRLPAPRLPRFELDAAAPSRKVPPVLLPRFPITDPVESRRVPAVRLPGHKLDGCPHCRHLAMILARTH